MKYSKEKSSTILFSDAENASIKFSIYSSMKSKQYESTDISNPTTKILEIFSLNLALEGTRQNSS